MRPKGRALTPKQARFVAEYLKDCNGAQAAIRAGYAKRSAKEQASRLLTLDSVAAAVQAGMRKVEARNEITKDRVLKELARIAFFDIRKLYDENGALKRPDQLDDDAAAVLAGVEVVEMAGGMKIEAGDEGAPVSHVPMYTKKAKVFDKGKAIELAMRHLGMLTGTLLDDDEPLPPSTVTVERRDARLAQ